MYVVILEVAEVDDGWCVCACECKLKNYFLKDLRFYIFAVL